jgi:branched-subunit amino acid aminotransferase/4-amino-4-deoxychorismate lyase
MQFNLEKALFFYQDTRNSGRYYRYKELTEYGITFTLCDFPLHYAGDVFEGERFFFDERQQKFFMWGLDKHVSRFIRSLKGMLIMKPDSLPYESFAQKHREEFETHGIRLDPIDINKVSFYPGTYEEIRDMFLETAKRNIESGHVTPKTDPGYARPLAGRGKKYDTNGQCAPELGIQSLSFSYFIANMVAPWGSYVKPPIVVTVYPEEVNEPLRRLKAQANYGLGSKLKNEARLSGFSDVLVTGHHPETPGIRYAQELTAMNFILILNNNKIVTPPLEEPILGGITRWYNIEVAKKLGYDITERPIMLQEIMENGSAIGLLGTATGVAPVDAIGDMEIDKVKFLDPQHKILLELKKQFDSSVRGQEIENTLKELRDSMRTPIEAKIPE